MDLNDLVTELAPPANRVGKCEGDYEHHLYEGAVMLAYAMHLFDAHNIDEVRIHPDGEHGKQFEFVAWLAKRGFRKTSSTGKTAYGGVYRDDAGRQIVVHPKSGLGDVVANLDEGVVTAECKGGIINTRHAGQLSRLRKGLCETVGLLMATQSAGRQVAVVPYTKTTEELAKRLAPRCALAGIEIALVETSGEVVNIRA
jgi:hypothetical protein